MKVGGLLPHPRIYQPQAADPESNFRLGDGAYVQFRYSPARLFTQSSTTADGAGRIRSDSTLVSSRITGATLAPLAPGQSPIALDPVSAPAPVLSSALRGAPRPHRYGQPSTAKPADYKFTERMLHQTAILTGDGDLSELCRCGFIRTQSLDGANRFALIR